MSRGADAAWGGALAAGVLATAWPWVGRLGTIPVTTDGAHWVGRSSLATPGWWRWDLLGSHFIGYRPLTALSFTVDSALGGLDPLAYRLTDLALYAATLVLVWLLFRALAPDRPRWGALVAVLAVALHPGVEEAVPMLARRSYLLATLLGAASVWALTRDVARDRVPWRAALLLLAAMLSNESAFALVAVLPLVHWHLASPGGRRALRALVPPGVALALAAGLRLGITGEVGGYGSMGLSLQGAARVAREAWSYLLFPPSATDAPAVILGGAVGAALVLAWLAWVGLGRPLWRRGEPAARVPLVFALWALAQVLLYMITGRWFFREAYPALVPLGLLVGVALADLSRARLLRVAGEAVPAGILAVALLAHSPVLRGPDALRTRHAADHQARAESLLGVIDTLDEPARVWLVVPVPGAHRKSNVGRRAIRYQAQRLSTWAGYRLAGRPVEVADAAYLVDERSPSHLGQGGAPVIAFPEGARVLVPRGHRSPGPHLDRGDLPAALEGESVYAIYFQGLEAVPVRLTGPVGPSRSGGPDPGGGSPR